MVIRDYFNIIIKEDKLNTICSKNNLQDYSTLWNSRRQWNWIKNKDLNSFPKNPA